MTLRWGVGARLGVALLLVLAGAFTVVYVAVVPSLERRLVDNRIEQLRETALNLRTEIPDQLLWSSWVELTSRRQNARVVLYQPLIAPNLLPVADSGERSDAVKDDPIARRSATTLGLESGTVERGGRPFAEAAVPVAGNGPFLLLSTPLQDAYETVDFVEQTILIAGLLAFGAALLVGFTAANVFAGRIRRLERAADRIASGRFDEPIVDRRTDELGELARAFDRMRERLAGFDHARSEFIANASHELRTPIFSLGGHLELLDDEELDEETRREFVAEMRSQVSRLGKLTEELLDLSRLDAGRLRVEQEPVDLAETIRLVVAELGPLALGSNHILEPRVERLDLGPCRQPARPPGRTFPRRERAAPHTGGDEGRDQRRAARRRGRADGDGRRAGHSGRASPTRVRPLLPGRRRHGLRQRPRARDRPRALGADGRQTGALRGRGQDDVYAPAAGRAGVST